MAAETGSSAPRDGEADSPTTGRVEGTATSIVAVGLLWYAAFTVAVNALVLGGARYAAIPWCLGLATLVALVGGPALARAAAAVPSLPPLPSSPGRGDWRLTVPILAMCALLSLVAAHTGNMALLVFAFGGAAALGLLVRVPAPAGETSGRRLALELAGFAVLLLILYLLGHRPDADDANYVNLAAGAQVSAHPVFAVDTMVGDGPHPIHLPTYKLHSFELLAASLSTLTGLAPISVLHLVLAVPLLLGAALIWMLVLRPFAGSAWLCAAIAGVGFLYANTDQLGTWGMHGPLRFFQGKGFLVTALVPLAAGLTARWMAAGRRVDLVLLALVHVCAIGFTANGLFVTPAASGFAALAAVIVRPGGYRRAIGLVPTLAYPAAMAALVSVLHLTTPSEVTETTNALSGFHFVAGWGWAGAIVMVLLPLASLGVGEGRQRVALALALPVGLACLALPPVWAVGSAVSGNLGFRLFWAFPAGPLAGLAVVGLFRLLGLQRPTMLAAAALVPLAGGVALNQAWAFDLTRIEWHRPGLRVEHPAFEIAEQLVAATPRGCDALAPERVSVWMTGDPAKLHLAVVRTLYLRHYRFSEPAGELAMRWRLARLVGDAPDREPLPTPSDLREARIRLGLVAVDAASPNRDRLAQLAASLGMSHAPRLVGGVEYWQGACAPPTAGSTTAP